MKFIKIFFSFNVVLLAVCSRSQAYTCDGYFNNNSRLALSRPSAVSSNINLSLVQRGIEKGTLSFIMDSINRSIEDLALQSQQSIINNQMSKPANLANNLFLQYVSQLEVTLNKIDTRVKPASWRTLIKSAAQKALEENLKSVSDLGSKLNTLRLEVEKFDTSIDGKIENLEYTKGLLSQKIEEFSLVISKINEMDLDSTPLGSDFINFLQKIIQEFSVQKTKINLQILRLQEKQNQTDEAMSLLDSLFNIKVRELKQFYPNKINIRDSSLPDSTQRVTAYIAANSGEAYLSNIDKLLPISTFDGRYRGRTAITAEEAVVLLQHMPRAVNWLWYTRNLVSYSLDLFIEKGIGYYSWDKGDVKYFLYDYDMAIRVLFSIKKRTLSDESRIQLKKEFESILENSKGPGNRIDLRTLASSLLT